MHTQDSFENQEEAKLDRGRRASPRKQKRKGENNGDCSDHSRSQKAYFVLGLTLPCTVLHSVFLITYDFAKVHIINEKKSSIQRLDNLPKLP